MRRMNGRSPPFVSVGLLVFIGFISYNLWTTSSINNDLIRENKKLQAEIKLSGLKKDQYEKKAELLQQNLYELDAKSAKLNKDFLNEEHKLGDAESALEMKEEILSKLQSDVKKLESAQSDLKLELEEKDNKILQIQKESQHVIDMKNEAEEIISERDELIKKLKQQLEQSKLELAMMQAKEPKVQKVPGMFNIPGAENAEPYRERGSLVAVNRRAVHAGVHGMRGIIMHPGESILPQEAPNVPRPAPQFPVLNVVKSQSDSPKSDGQLQAPSENKLGEIKLPQVQNVIHNPEDMKQEGNPLGIQNISGVLSKPDPAKDVQEDNISVIDAPHSEKLSEKRVLPPPIQNLDDNPDVAIDDDVKDVDDPADDQDEEGKEIQRDLVDPADEDAAAEEKDIKRNLDDFNNNVDYDVDLGQLSRKKLAHVRHEPQGIGGGEAPVGAQPQPEENYVNFGAEEKPGQNTYDVNLSNQMRNIGRLR